MPMARDDHEAILTDLLNPELEQSRRTELLQNLRADYSGVLTDHEKMTQDLTKLRADNDDLIVSNSKLFRQIGIEGGGEDKKREEEQKTFSETITVSAIEKGMVK